MKAKSEQAFFKAALYGKPGSGKTLTSLIWAEVLAAREGKRIAHVDTERGVEFYTLDIPERTVHPRAFDFDRLITRSLMETIEAVESLDPKVYGVLIIDSITCPQDSSGSICPRSLITARRRGERSGSTFSRGCGGCVLRSGRTTPWSRSCATLPRKGAERHERQGR